MVDIRFEREYLDSVACVVRKVWSFRRLELYHDPPVAPLSDRLSSECDCRQEDIAMYLPRLVQDGHAMEGGGYCACVTKYSDKQTNTHDEIFHVD